MAKDSWPGDCHYCEAGKCNQCSGRTMEGFGCECEEAGHYGMNDEVDDEVGPGWPGLYPPE